MAYSKSYQDVIAGRVRENEKNDFFGDNAVATPAGTFRNVRSSGGGQTPEITKKEDMKTEYAGKERPSDGSGKVSEAMLSGSNNAM